MSGFPKKDRQKIIDGYLAETGRNMFVAGEFIDWLGEHPDHVAYPWFFSKSDTEAAREYRIALARQMVSGLRITARVEERSGKVVSVSMRDYPAYQSPIDGRKSGGGYIPVDPEDAQSVAELRRQGTVALKSWFNRYAGAFGDDARPVYDLLEALSEAA